jgi:hypothetical protein
MALRPSHPSKPENFFLRLQERANKAFRKLLFFLHRHVSRVMLALFRIVEIEIFVGFDFEAGKNIRHV